MCILGTSFGAFSRLFQNFLKNYWIILVIIIAFSPHPKKNKKLINKIKKKFINNKK